MLIEKELLQRLVNKLAKQFGYKINVMDEKAIIIASYDPSRLGDFHEGAHRIINNRESIDIAYPGSKKIGIQSGVSFPMRLHGKIVGVFGITGSPDEVLPIAKLIKLTFETMLEYELYKSSERKTIVNSRKFVRALCYDMPPNLKLIRQYAKEEGYREDACRLPILVKASFTTRTNTLLQDYRRDFPDTDQDIVFLSSNNSLVVYKAIPKNQHKHYKRFAHEVWGGMRPILEGWCDQPTADMPALFGVPLVSFTDYSRSLLQLDWLVAHIDGREQAENYFSDFLFPYMLDHVSFEDYRPLCAYYALLIGEGKERDAFSDMIEAFFETEMNYEKCAQSLYLHKNTVFNHMSRIRNRLEIGSLKNIHDCILLFFLSYIFKNNDGRW